MVQKKSNKSNKLNKSINNINNIIFNNKLFKNKIFNNLYYLYFLFILTFIVVLNYFFSNNYQAIILFTIIFLFSYYFNKNLSIVLTFALAILFLTNLLDRLFNKKEGFKEGKDSKDDSDDKSEPESKDDDNEDEDGADDDDNNDDEDDDDTGSSDAISPQMTKKIENQIAKITSSSKSDKKEKKEPSNKDSYTNIKLKPASYDKKPKARGKLSDVEKGYNDLSKILEGNDIKSLSGSTKNIMKQQEEMVKHLNDMTPIVEKAINTVSNLDLGGLKQVFDGVTNLSNTL